MSFLKEAVWGLCAKAQDVLSRSERAWFAACDAWNEEFGAQAQQDQTTSQEVPEFVTKLKGKRDKKKAGKSDPVIVKKREKFAAGTGKKVRLGSSADLSIKATKEAIEHALLFESLPSDASRLILWTDASGQSGGKGRPRNEFGPAAIAVVFQRKFDWVRITARLNQFNSVNLGETQAIVHALDYAVQLAGQPGADLRRVDIFTDSQAALVHMVVPPKLRRKTRKSAYEALVALLEEASSLMEALHAAGVSLDLHWAPRGKARGNKVADAGSRLARLATEELTSPDDVKIELIPCLDDKRLLAAPIKQTIATQRARMAEEVVTMLTSLETPPPLRPPFDNSASMESPAAAQSLTLDQTLYPVAFMATRPVSEDEPMLAAPAPAPTGVESESESEFEHGPEPHPTLARVDSASASESEFEHGPGPEPQPRLDLEPEPELQTTERVGLNMPPAEAAFVREVVILPERWAAPRSDRAEERPDDRDASRC